MSMQPAYVLHTRAYRESSLLVELFAQQHGRLTAVARGVRRPKSTWKGVLQPFIPVLVNWVGKGDLVTLTAAEAAGVYPPLLGTRLICGLYMNELLTRLLLRHDPYPQLFADYQQAIIALAHDAPLAQTLRRFEKQLLQELGYGLALSHDCVTGNAVQEDKCYRYTLQHGLTECSANQVEPGELVISGHSLLALQQDCFSDRHSLQEAKQLLQYVLADLLGPKPLQTRELLRLHQEP